MRKNSVVQNSVGPAVVMLAEVSGTVWSRAEGETEMVVANAGMRLPAGDLQTQSPMSPAVLRFNDGTDVALILHARHCKAHHMGLRLHPRQGIMEFLERGIVVGVRDVRRHGIPPAALICNCRLQNNLMAHECASEEMSSEISFATCDVRIIDC